MPPAELTKSASGSAPNPEHKAVQKRSEQGLMVSLGPDLESFTSKDSLGLQAGEWMNILNGYTKVGYWLVDIASGMVRWSPRTYEIHGLPYEDGHVPMTEAIKKYHPDDMPILMSLIEQAVENKCGFSFQLRLIDASGAVKDVVSVAAFKTDEQGQEILHGIFHEVIRNQRGVPTLHSVAF